MVLPWTGDVVLPHHGSLVLGGEESRSKHCPGKGRLRMGELLLFQISLHFSNPAHIILEIFQRNSGKKINSGPLFLKTQLFEVNQDIKVQMMNSCIL